MNPREAIAVGIAHLSVEFQMPLYQHLTGTQLKTTWKLILG